MSSSRIDRRTVLVGGGSLAAAAALRSPALAKGLVTAAVYPGTWDEAYRGVVAPALKKTRDVELALEPLFAVDQIAKAQAARGAPPFDAFVLDPGPRAQAIARGLFEKFDPSRLANASKVPAGFADQYGIAVNAQIVGIAYNPKKLPPPKSWKHLFAEPYVSRLGLTGFQTTFGTVSLIEIAKAYGGSDTDVDPAFVEIKKALPKVAAVMAPAALPGLFQQGQIDICYTNTNNVASLKTRGVDIEFAFPEEGGITFITTLHIAKAAENVENAYAYIDTALSADVQAQLMKPPSSMIPTNKDVVLADLPIKNVDDLARMKTHDWSKINPLRAHWIERFDKEVSK
jgi:putative spermidine/putrescine transport system substrate-binding protein